MTATERLTAALDAMKVVKAKHDAAKAAYDEVVKELNAEALKVNDAMNGYLNEVVDEASVANNVVQLPVATPPAA